MGSGQTEAKFFSIFYFFDKYMVWFKLLKNSFSIDVYLSNCYIEGMDSDSPKWLNGGRIMSFEKKIVLAFVDTTSTSLLDLQSG